MIFLTKFKKYIISLSFVFFALFSTAYAEVIRVTIDAGHGGRDFGASNRGLKINEKTLTLQMAKKLKKYFEQDKHFKVFMTRESDKYLELKDRVKIAQKNNSDIFVSIHVNYTNHKNVYGIDVFVQSPKRIRDEVQRFLNNKAVIKSDELGFLGADLKHNSKMDSFLMFALLDSVYEESKKMATKTLESIVRNKFPLHDKSKRASMDKVKEQGLQVLVAPNIVSVLVETGYLTNNNEGKKLKQASYQNRLMKSVYLGVKNYVNKHQNNLISLRKVREPFSPKQYYRVKKGDSLFAVARKFDVSVTNIKEWNHLRKSTIYPNQKLRVK